VKCVREIINTHEILVRKAEGKCHLVDLDVGGRKILKLILWICDDS